MNLSKLFTASALALLFSLNPVISYADSEVCVNGLEECDVMFERLKEFKTEVELKREKYTSLKENTDAASKAFNEAVSKNSVYATKNFDRLSSDLYDSAIKVEELKGEQKILEVDLEHRTNMYILKCALY